MENKNEKKKEKKNWSWIIIAVLIVVIILLLLRSCGTEPVVNNDPVNTDPVIDAPIGNFEVSDSQKEKEETPSVPIDNRTITFAGYDNFSVSKENPSVEMKNPEVNFVDMVFTLKDKASGEIIARTDKVAAGEFVYVNVLDYYKVSGTYNVIILTSTYDSETGVQMNGMNQEMEVIIK